MIKETLDDSSQKNVAWKHAEAYHFYILAQQHLNAGRCFQAYLASNVLLDYADIIPRRNIYQIIVLSSIHVRQYQTFESSISRLLTESSLSNAEKQKLETIRKGILAKYSSRHSVI